MVHERMPPYVRTGALIVFAVNLIFLWLDAAAFGPRLAGFAGVRIALAALVLMVLALASRWPRISQWMLVLGTEGMLISALYWSGDAPTTDYYAGLVLFCCGLSVLVPFRPWEAGLACGLALGAFAVSPWLTESFGDWRSYRIHAVFVGSAALVGVGSGYRLERSRWHDFLQRRELERARDDLAELDRAKSRFTANVHHELRTPLTLMLAPLEALRSGDLGELPAGIDRTLRTMHANGLRLLKLINQLLDLARIENDPSSLRRVPLAVERLTAEVVEGARALAERKGLALTLRVAPDVGEVNADAEAFEKVLVNLLGNALKFTTRGGIEVELLPGPEAAGGGVHLVVRDTGMGIAAEELERVFDRFAQADASSTRRHEGTGIGLSLVKELVMRHGGRVWAESGGPEQGAALHALWPRGRADAAADEEVLLGEADGPGLTAAASFEALGAELGVAPAPAQAAAGPQGADAESERALEAELPVHEAGTPEVVVAEDNPEMRRLLGLLIGREYRVRLARDGAEALAQVRARAPQLVVTDVMMPELSGTQLCRAIKADAATRGVPVMLVTSKAERAMKIEGLELGAEDYLTKPFHPRELMARVRALVRLRTLQQELAASNASLAERNAELGRTLAELKAAEVQLVQAERLSAVGELSAGVAHEVNNPLNFARHALVALGEAVVDVQGFARRRLTPPEPGARTPGEAGEEEPEKEAEALERTAQELGELADIVREGVERTARLVAELRDFAAPTRRTPGPVDAVAGLRATLRLLGPMLRAAKVQLETDLPEGISWVEGDAGALNQVFLNLLKNAAEALESQGGGALHVGARAGARSLVITLRDEGPGMDAATRARLFEPFFTTKPAGRGTGLGLSICRRIVTEHRGQLELHSAPGQGTRVRIELPRAGTPRAGTHDAEEDHLGA